MEGKTVSVLEDDRNILELIQFNLESAGFKVSCHTNGNDFFLGLKTLIPDLILLDIMLPQSDGLTILKSLKSNVEYKDIPVIMLTARKSEMDKVLGLELGSDDYITKPFSIKELVARIHAVLRRGNLSEIETGGAVHHYMDLVLDSTRHTVIRNGIPVSLPLKQFSLLETFISNPGMVFTREVLLEKVWGFDYYGDTRTVDVHIRYLRKSLGDADGESRYIETVRGVGYKLKC
ncbi:MAG: response regulator transcription factor [Clostridia bacterium]